MASKIIIKIKNEKKVEEFIKIAISLYEPNSVELKNENIYKFDKYVYALSNLIAIDNIKDVTDSQSLIRSAIQKTKDFPQFNLEDYVKSLEEIGANALKKQKERFYFVFPLKIKYTSINKRHFNLFNDKIKIYSYKYILKNFDCEKIKNKAKYVNKIKESFKPSFTYFVIEEYSTDVYRAEDSAVGKIELLRSIINFVDDLGTLHLMGEAKPISLIYPSHAFFAFDSNKNYLAYWTTSLTHESKEIDFNHGLISQYKVIEETERLLKVINSINKGSLRTIISNALYLYNEALDNYETKWVSFLNLWQIFELIARASQNNLKQGQVRKRIVSLLDEKDLYENIFEVIKDKRNKSVHEGIIKEITHHDINMVIEVAQHAIVFLIFNAKKLKNVDGLEFFYNNVNTFEKNLHLKRDILNHIEKINK